MKRAYGIRVHGFGRISCCDYHVSCFQRTPDSPWRPLLQTTCVMFERYRSFSSLLECWLLNKGLRGSNETNCIVIWLARRITSFKANHSGSLKTPTLTTKFRLVQNSTPGIVLFSFSFDNYWQSFKLLSFNWPLMGH